MPELPEVETSRAHVEKFCQGSKIIRCITAEQGGGPRDGRFDDIVIGEDLTAEQLRNSLEGRTIVELKRRGKQLWFVLDKPPHPLFHFGMTGAFTVKGKGRHKFVKFKVSEEWPPKFTKLELQMSNGACLALTDPRRLARVRLREEPENQPPISLLGPDPLTHPLALETFALALAKISASIKAVLLDQDRVVSGVGNWIADEVCFQACVHPGSACNTLAPEQVAALHTKLLSICREASELRADYTVFPPDWLFHHRWGKGKASGGAPHVSSGHPIKFDVVGGRTTAFVPTIQRKGLLSPEQRKASQGKGKKIGVEIETCTSASKAPDRSKRRKNATSNAGAEGKKERLGVEATSSTAEMEDGTWEKDDGDGVAQKTKETKRVTAGSRRGTRGNRSSLMADVKVETGEAEAPARLKETRVVGTSTVSSPKPKAMPSNLRVQESGDTRASTKAKRKRKTQESQVADVEDNSQFPTAVGHLESHSGTPRTYKLPPKQSRAATGRSVGTRRSPRLSLKCLG